MPATSELGAEGPEFKPSLDYKARCLKTSKKEKEKGKWNNFRFQENGAQKTPMGRR